MAIGTSYGLSNLDLENLFVNNNYNYVSDIDTHDIQYTINNITKQTLISWINNGSINMFMSPSYLDWDIYDYQNISYWNHHIFAGVSNISIIDIEVDSKQSLWILLIANNTHISLYSSSDAYNWSNMYYFNISMTPEDASINFNPYAQTNSWIITWTIDYKLYYILSDDGYKWNDPISSFTNVYILHPNMIADKSGVWFMLASLVDFEVRDIITCYNGFKWLSLNPSHPNTINGTDENYLFIQKYNRSISDINRIQYDKNDQHIVIVATNGYTYSSNDNGSTWTLITVLFEFYPTINVYNETSFSILGNVPLYHVWGDTLGNIDQREISILRSEDDIIKSLYVGPYSVILYKQYNELFINVSLISNLEDFNDYMQQYIITPSPMINSSSYDGYYDINDCKINDTICEISSNLTITNKDVYINKETKITGKLVLINSTLRINGSLILNNNSKITIDQNGLNATIDIDGCFDPGGYIHVNLSYNMSDNMNDYILFDHSCITNNTFDLYDYGCDECEDLNDCGEITYTSTMTYFSFSGCGTDLDDIGQTKLSMIVIIIIVICTILSVVVVLLALFKFRKKIFPYRDIPSKESGYTLKKR